MHSVGHSVDIYPKRQSTKIHKQERIAYFTGSMQGDDGSAQGFILPVVAGCFVDSCEVIVGWTEGMVGVGSEDPEGIVEGLDTVVAGKPEIAGESWPYSICECRNCENTKGCGMDGSSNRASHSNRSKALEFAWPAPDA